jgi:transposase-like protein
MKTRQTRGEVRRWTAEEARQVLAAQEASGESLAGFARKRGLKAQRLQWWRSRLAAWEQPAQTLVPAVVEARALPAVRLRVAGVEVEIAEPVEAGWLAELIRRLEFAP